MDRRTFVASVPLAAGGLCAASAIARSAQSEDPAIAAFGDLERHTDVLTASYRAGLRERDEDAADAVHDAWYGAQLRLAETVATTPDGLVCQLLLMCLISGDLRREDDWQDVDAYQFGRWKGDLDGHLLRNLLAGVKNLAEARQLRANVVAA